MNDTHIHRQLIAFTIAAAEHQRLDREHRSAWRYRHRQEEIRPRRNAALQTTERHLAHLMQALADLPEPTYLSRTARALIEQWEQYRRNHAIMVAEYNGENQKRTATSRTLFENKLKETAETLKTLQNQNPTP